MTAQPWRVREHGLGDRAHAVRSDRVEVEVDGVPYHLTVCGWSISSQARAATDTDHRCTDCERITSRTPTGQLTLDDVGASS